MNKTVTLTVQKLGDDLVLRIPAKLAKEQRLTAGQQLEIQLDSSAPPEPSALAPPLAQLLAQFDPAKDGGEAMATTPTGVEAM
ncbi:PbsX family transcriptional regulator [Rugamonas sp. CCM 8940]|uniref:AbrB/MazE/SpoVT family DNA-binding domain-containing protein n=1 Tax=Rugamonas sp. CCM 8940 TaxID=2765359 RepID=UPI0018F51051|nr:PbsX family transcriptional regulator [Rugamonas sp. CCM 8940]MBJ7312105.1 PbsX family transcriptional regulator [Rugamonas sp. CCM 8940]